MWAMVAGAANPEKFIFTVTMVCAWLRTTMPEPVAVLPLGGTSCDPVSVALNTWLFGTHVGVGVAAGVGVGVAGGGVGVGVGVEPSVTSRNAAVIGPQVWKPWKSFTPRPRTKITWRPTDRLAVFMVALTATVAELNVPLIGMAVPPAQGGVSM